MSDFLMFPAVLWKPTYFDNKFLKNTWQNCDREHCMEATQWHWRIRGQDSRINFVMYYLHPYVPSITTKVHFCAKLEVYSLRLIKWLITLLFVLSSWTVFYSIVHIFSQKHILTKDVISRHGREAQHTEIALFKIT